MNTQPEAGRLAYIYALIDDQGRARYIGHTGKPLNGTQSRAYVHWAHRKLDDDRRNPRLNAWLRTLDAPPQALALAAVPYAQRFTAETAWTHFFRWATGEQLLNINAGNQKVPEVIARVSATQKRHHASRKQLQLTAAA
ncbi:hypothetical protein GCM10018777_31440 [Streptomyces albogriseolus]|uniref:hypothetical protein n=1 Tax=Streptomyces TaxID=1883 RepID=UPI00167723AC|nr:hypothetical protein [Streptomyces viridodiastaticus]GHG15413.1 hypothetical protein GCM10018777_31440 [Streptomyces viridodiastaticus]